VDGLGGNARTPRVESSRVEAIFLETGCGAPSGSKGWRVWVSKVEGGVVGWWGRIVG